MNFYDKVYFIQFGLVIVGYFFDGINFAILMGIICLLANTTILKECE